MPSYARFFPRGARSLWNNGYSGRQSYVMYFNFINYQGDYGCVGQGEAITDTGFYVSSHYWSSQCTG